MGAVGVYSRANSGVRIAVRTLLVGLIVGLSFPAQAAEALIKFAPKMFSDGPEVIEVSGTLTGAGVGYPNNTNVVTCWKDRKECSVVSVEADREFVSRVTGPAFYPIVSWSDSEVVAQEEAAYSSSCSRTTITIARKRGMVLWVQEPINQTKTWCAKSETKVLKFTIEDPPHYKR